MSRLPTSPLHHVVMDASAHKGIDYVNGDFGPKARIDRRALQLRWLDHFVKGLDNGVEAQAPLDLFVIGDNTWRKEHEWPLARTVWTNFYLRQNGTLDTAPPAEEAPDEYTYDPGNPTPFLVDVGNSAHHWHPRTARSSYIFFRARGVTSLLTVLELSKR